MSRNRGFAPSNKHVEVAQAIQDQTLINYGSIDSLRGAGINLAGGGSVGNQSDAMISGQQFGIFLHGATGSVANSGTIASSLYSGIVMQNGGTLNNKAGATVSGGSDGVGIASSPGTVYNSGRISRVRQRCSSPTAAA